MKFINLLEFNYLKETEFYLNREIEKHEFLSNIKIKIPEDYVRSWIKSNNDEKTQKNY